MRMGPAFDYHVGKISAGCLVFSLFLLFIVSTASTVGYFGNKCAEGGGVWRGVSPFPLGEVSEEGA